MSISLHFTRNILPEGEAPRIINSLCWNPRGTKMAVMTSDLSVYIYNDRGARLEKLSLRPLQFKERTKAFLGLALCYSPDGTYLAVGQSDKVCYVFRVEGESRAIVMRLVTEDSVTAVAWPETSAGSGASQLILGTASGNLYSVDPSTKAINPLASAACIAQLLTQRTNLADGQTTPPTPGAAGVQSIHQASGQCIVVVLETGLAFSLDIGSQQMKTVARHALGVTASCLAHPRGNASRSYLILADLAAKLTAYSVETGQAMCNIALRDTSSEPATCFTAACANPLGGSVVFSNAQGLQVLTISSQQPLSIVSDPSSSILLKPTAKGSRLASISALSWRPDASLIIAGTTGGRVDSFSPTVGAFKYCGADVTNSAPNKSVVKIPGHSSSLFAPGVVELHCQQSSDIKQLRAYPKSLFQEYVAAAGASGGSAPRPPPGLYLVARGDRSSCVYSFEQDTVHEIAHPFNEGDRLYFDVGVKRAFVLSSPTVGEFVAGYLPTNSRSATVFSPVHGCCQPASSVISCFPVFRNDILEGITVAHLGEDRRDIVIESLTPPELCGDFAESSTPLFRQKHSKAIDYVDISPSGTALLIRDVSGGVGVVTFSAADQRQRRIVLLSSSVGNGNVQWAAPYDVIVGQEGPDSPVSVWYNPLDDRDQPSLLQPPSGGSGWVIAGVGSRPASRNELMSAGDSLGPRSVGVTISLETPDSGKRVDLALDSNLLLFSVLMTNGNVSGACLLLNAACTGSGESDRAASQRFRPQWQRLCAVALDQCNLAVASRCFAALGELALVRYCRSIIQRVSADSTITAAIVADYKKAQVALMRSDLDLYERYMAQCGRTEEALSLYRELRLYTRAEKIAPPNAVQAIRKEAVDWLVTTGQATTAGAMLAQRGDFRGALDLLIGDRSYLAAYELTRRILAQRPSAISQQLVEQLIQSLDEAGQYQQAGILCVMPPLSDNGRGLAYLRRAEAFSDAIQVARQHLPHECVYIEKEWADHLFASGHYTQAIEHYVEAHDPTRAVECALRGGDIETAESILSGPGVSLSSGSGPHGADGTADLALRVAEAKYMAGDVDAAAGWLVRADTPLLALTAYTCMGKFEEAVTFVRNTFPRQNHADILSKEAERICRLSTRAPELSGTSLVANLIYKIEGMSSVRGPLAAKDLLVSAGMLDEAADILRRYSCWDDLVAFAREYHHKYLDTLRICADAKKMRNDVHGCVILLDELCLALAKQKSGKAGGSSGPIRDAFGNIMYESAADSISAGGQEVAKASTQLTEALREAISLYGSIGQHSEAVRLAKACRDETALKEAIGAWLGGMHNITPAVVSQLRQYGLLDASVAQTAERGQFDLALQLCEYTSNEADAKAKVRGMRYAALEKAGNFTEAEKLYRADKKLLDCIEMYIRVGRVPDAERIAAELQSETERFRANRVIREGKADFLLKEGRIREAEPLMLELHKVSELVEAYKSRNLWQDAIRIAREHGTPQMVSELSEAFARKDAVRDPQKQAQKPAAKPAEAALSAQKASSPASPGSAAAAAMAALQSGSIRASMVSAARAGGETFTDVVLSRSHQIALKVLERQIDDQYIREDMVIVGSLVSPAREPKTPAERAAVVVTTYLSLGIPRALLAGAEAKGMVSPLISPTINPDYLLAICKMVLGVEYTEDDYLTRVCKLEAAGEGLYTRLRNILLTYRSAILSTSRGQQAYGANKSNFIPGNPQLSRCFEAAHLIVMFAQALHGAKSLNAVREQAQVASSLVRYCDLLPVDRCFALAGRFCCQFCTLSENQPNERIQAFRKAMLGQAYVFLNRLMDIYEAYDEKAKDTGDLDAQDLAGTGIPWDVPLNTSPSRIPYCTPERRKELKSFVMQLSLSTDDDVGFELPKEPCPTGCGFRRWIGALECSKCRHISPICAIGGNHVINPSTHSIPVSPACQVCGCYARPSPWNSWITRTKSCPVCGELGNPIGK